MFRRAQWRCVFATIAVASWAPSALAAVPQKFLAYDAAGNNHGYVSCSASACDVFTSASTPLGSVRRNGLVTLRGRQRGYVASYGENWRPADFWVRPVVEQAAAVPGDDWATALALALSGADPTPRDEQHRLELMALQAVATVFEVQSDTISVTQLAAEQQALHDHNAAIPVLITAEDTATEIMVRGLWVLAFRPADGQSYDVFWSGERGIESARVSRSELMRGLASLGVIVGTNDHQVEAVPVRDDPHAHKRAGASNLCVSGSPVLRSHVESMLRNLAGPPVRCDYDGNDLVLEVRPTGRWMPIADLNRGPKRQRQNNAFEAVAVLRDRNGTELWSVRKGSWEGYGHDRRVVAQQIAKAFTKFFGSFPWHGSGHEAAAGSR